MASTASAALTPPVQEPFSGLVRQEPASTVLQVFCTSCTTGSFPDNLTAGSDGNMYGTTEGGGLIAGVTVCQNLAAASYFASRLLERSLLHYTPWMG